jgi:integrase
MRLSDAIDAYCDFRTASGIKPNSVKNDRCYLGQFLTFTGNIYVRSVEPRHVDRFFAEHPEWSVPTRNLAVTILRTFFTYARRQKWCHRDQDPIAGYRTRKVPQKEMLRVPVSDFAALLDAAEHPRNRMIVALGLFLFLRQSEMREIRIGDVNLDLGEIAVKVPKTDDYDVMVVNEQLDVELRRYLKWYTETHGELNPEWFLIPAKNAMVWVRDPETGYLRPDVDNTKVKLRPFKPCNEMEKPVQDALKKLGYPTYWQGVHTLRRSGARAFYNELCRRQSDNSALEVVSAMLHHSSLLTTQRYLGITESRKRRDKAVLAGPMFPAMEPQDNVFPLLGEVAGDG